MVGSPRRTPRPDPKDRSEAVFLIQTRGRQLVAYEDYIEAEEVGEQEGYNPIVIKLVKKHG